MVSVYWWSRRLRRRSQCPTRCSNKRRIRFLSKQILGSTWRHHQWKTAIQSLWNVHAFWRSYVLPVLVDRVLDGRSKSTFFISSFIVIYSSNSFLSGGDFHICTDGNFHHRHLISGGCSIPFHNPKHIIPKSFVDEIGEHITRARKSPAKHRRSRVPDEAIDDCEDAYEAANGDKKKAASGEARYDDRGWMSLVCRHDIPLFFSNIDTPGEQYKFAIALILWFAKHIPKNATFSVLYDIGCIIHRSCLKVRPANHDTTKLTINIFSSISFLQAS